ncbi:hypothetical protein DM01DRAFT_1002662 [Hesseltinella vesiculosa]|uniref:BSD domain-containing protein n=1 Tax=Hesseltinella vesiculosa TaxID=101127 RepID=A0A1X2GX50_9FUNG|nr:hypothetical protein DM01DRAFT_1002662 [Hesseltinella vesiculosa]
MWEPNEQLLLRVQVKYKKKDGSLFVTPRRVAFQENNVPQLTPSIYYDTITSLQQTPESAPKVQFKIVTNPPDSKAYTFHFTSGRALIEREGVKAQVAELLAKAKGTTPSSLGTPAPFTPSGVPSPATPSTPSNQQPTSPSTAAPTPSTPASAVPATPASAAPSRVQSPANASSPRNMHVRHHEFAARKQLLSSSRELQKLHKELVLTTKAVSEEEFWSSSYIKRVRQKLKLDPAAKEGKQKGKSSRLVELKPGQQEGSDIKYTLTSQMIHNIFSEYPSVKRAYDTNVPDKLSEQHFWKRFLASEFFHRSRSGGRSQLTPYDDIFDRCLEEENAEDARGPDLALLENIKQTINLEASREDHDESGNAPDFTMVPGKTEQVLPLLRRFNRHSSRVLDIQPKTNKPKPSSENSDSYLEDEILLADLTDNPPPEKIVLDIQDTSRHFESLSSANATKELENQNVAQVLSSFKRQFEHWQGDLTKPTMPIDDANGVCSDLNERIRKKSRRKNGINSGTKIIPVIPN